ncbi:MAG: Crp/Fnr family transcriptional regulator [Cytophagaceae bacterium]|nr:Crp/Fnr family transcriptional regulator [Cytophagaceae bacterium]
MSKTNSELHTFKSSEFFHQLQSSGSTKEFKEGSILLDESANIHLLPIVLKGLIKVLRTDEDGREILLYYIQPGESCIMSFLGGIHQEKSKIRAVAEESCELLLIHIDRVKELLKEHPQWLDYIFRLYHKRFEELLEVVNAVAFKKMDERLLETIRKKCRMNQIHTIYMTHEQLASEMGTSRVVVSRLLKQLEDSGYLQLARNKISLINNDINHL